MRALPLPGGFALVEAGAPDLQPVVLHSHLFIALVGVEIQWGRVLVYTGGWRTASYNTAVKGLKDSRHLTGRAVDIRTLSLTASEIEALAVVCRANGLQVEKEQTHLHVELP